MTCLIPDQWPVQIEDDDPENGNEAKYSKADLKNLTVKENKNARLNVFVCFVTNLIIQVIMSFVDIAVKDTNLLEELDINTTDANSANNFYKSMTDVYAPLALFLMSITSYKVTVAVGSLLVCSTFINISFYIGPEGTSSWYWQVWLCGPAAVGVSCLKLGAMIPVLEYYKRDRLKALIITRVGTVLGAAATIGIMFAESLSWKTLFRINAGVCIPCFAIAFILKDIVITEKLKEENKNRKEKNANKGEVNNACCRFLKRIFSIPILKDKTFWITIVGFFFFRFGKSLPTFSLPEISTELQEQLAPPVDSFYEVLSSNVGKLVGLILTFALKSLKCVKRYRERKHKMRFVFGIITLSGYIMAIPSFITSDDYIYYIVYILVLTIFEVLAENFRDDSMSTTFGRFTIRLTEGFLHISMGLAGVAASTYHNVIDKTENVQGWKLNFRLGGGSFLISGSITGIVLIIYIISKKKRVNKFSHGTNPEQNSDDRFDPKCRPPFTNKVSPTSNMEPEKGPPMPLPKTPDLENSIKIDEPPINGEEPDDTSNQTESNDESNSIGSSIPSSSSDSFEEGRKNDEEKAMECPKFEKALAPPTQPTFRNRRITYEANRTKNAQKEKQSEPREKPRKGLENDDKRTPKRNRRKKNKKKLKRKYLFEASDSEEQAMDCSKLQTALAPPTKPIYRNRRLIYEAQREKSLEPRETSSTNLNNVHDKQAKITLN